MLDGVGFEGREKRRSDLLTDTGYEEEKEWEYPRRLMSVWWTK